MINILKIAFFFVILLTSLYFLGGNNSEIFAQQTLVVKLAAVYLSGFFYTSFLTSPLSVVLLISLALTMNPYVLTAVAGLGAVTGDLFIIKMFRTLFSVFSFVRHKNSFKAIKKILKRYHLDAVALFFGLVIIASPFPDELGLILLGSSRLSYFKLGILTFLLNSAGILIIVMLTRAVK